MEERERVSIVCFLTHIHTYTQQCHAMTSLIESKLNEVGDLFCDNIGGHISSDEKATATKNPPTHTSDGEWLWPSSFSSCIPSHFQLFLCLSYILISLLSYLMIVLLPKIFGRIRTALGLSDDSRLVWEVRSPSIGAVYVEPDAVLLDIVLRAGMCMVGHWRSRQLAHPINSTMASLSMASGDSILSIPQIEDLTGSTLTFVFTFNDRIWR